MLNLCPTSPRYLLCQCHCLCFNSLGNDVLTMVASHPSLRPHRYPQLTPAMPPIMPPLPPDSPVMVPVPTAQAPLPPGSVRCRSAPKSKVVLQVVATGIMGRGNDVNHYVKGLAQKIKGQGTLKKHLEISYRVVG